MSGRMGSQPPAPIECEISTSSLLMRHSIRLQTEIANEMRQAKHYQEIER